jgi:crotonobetainyl-CoA:carnitine CoA-transferase CaiB-like acyl-CoA transferase
VTERPAALAGLTVLDLATFLAAPVCATLLGEFGAEVIKVEQPGVGDDLRRLGRPAAQGGPSYWWLVEARNKKSITCNLRAPEGQALVRRLVAGAQVVTENFRPGTLERWSLGWADLARVNPALVLVRISGFGQTGPYRERPGFGRIAAAFGGLAYVCGYPDRAPVPPGTPTVPDYLAGVFGALGALVALRYAEGTGQGQVVDVGLYEPVLRVLDDAIAVHGGTGLVRERAGSGADSAVPHDHYRTRDGRWIAIACTNDRMFARLLAAMGRAELAGDPRLTTTGVRLQHRELVDGLVAAWVAERDAAETLGVLAAAEVPASPVMSVRDLFADPHVRAREDILTVMAGALGAVTMPGVVPRLGATPGCVASPGPLRPGEHNEEVYGGRLGLSGAELDGLRARGVI